jgi:predicted secreted protein
MTIFGGIIIYTLIWMVVLFTILPLGIKNQVETSNWVKGTDPGAPVESNIKKKLLITTFISAFLFIIIFIIDFFNLIIFRNLF